MVVVIHMVIWLDMVDVSDSWNIIIILVDNVVGIRQVSMREIGINILFRKRSVGVFCLVFNCSEQIEYRVMTRIFSGVVQCGAWTCLDEFNRINVEVMSVIAQQLGDIR